MNIVVVNGTEVKGCTFNIKERFLDHFRRKDQIVEFHLPGDSPEFCTGCKTCFDKGEEYCPHAHKSIRIWEAIIKADLIVFAYPVYAMRAPGQVKCLLDHFACHWMVHRPKEEMFTKRAVILTQSIGAPNGGAQKDVKTSLRWLGVSDIKCQGFKMTEGIQWDRQSEKKKKAIEDKLGRLALKCQGQRPSKQGNRSKLLFMFSRMVQKSLRKKGLSTLDIEYWTDKGWLD